MKDFQLSSFDLIVAVVLIVGVVRGRKRGMSEELLDVTQWLGIVFAGAFLYLMLGQQVAALTKLPNLGAFLLSYIFIGVIIAAVFAAIKRAVGEKLVQSDTFGRMEYYLGMMAGMVRFSCILLTMLAMLNAKYSTPAERAATAKMQRDNFGSISFPTMDSIQQTVFYESYSGKFIQKHLAQLLIAPVPPGPIRPTDNIGTRRERAVNEVIGK